MPETESPADAPWVAAVVELRRESVLLDRDLELGMLDELVQGALAGEPILALLEGPAGIGKSRLLAEARKKAATAGFGVLTGEW